MARPSTERNVVQLTRGPKHHFFGYYDMPTWDSTDRYVLALESDFDDRFPTAEDTAVIGMVDWETKEFNKLAETRAWNLQQGCMLHWLPTAPDREIIYNDRDGDHFISVIMDVFTGKKRVLPRPIAGITNDGRKAFSLNYARMRMCRRVVGYAGIDDPNHHIPHPDDDGVFLMDLETGESELVVSFAQAYATRAIDDPLPRSMWFNHTTVNTDDTRFTWAACYNPSVGPRAGRRTAGFFVANLDGTELTSLTPYYHVSHHDWLNPEQIMVWTDLDGQGACFNLLNVVTGEYEPVAREEVRRDGHCSFTREGKWFLVDSYPDEDRMQSLLLWNMAEKRLVKLGEFYSPPYATGDVRCDLHPRWDRHNRWISFDGVHGGTRQVYALDASEALAS